MAVGEDDRALELGDDVKSISSENTFLRDTAHRPTLRQCLREQADEIAARMQKRRLAARTVQVKVRYSDFSTLTRSHSAPATCDRAAIVARALELLLKTEAGVRPVRLLGVSVHNFGDDAATPSPRVDLLPFDLPE